MSAIPQSGFADCLSSTAQKLSILTPTSQSQRRTQSARQWKSSRSLSELNAFSQSAQQTQNSLLCLFFFSFAFFLFNNLRKSLVLPYRGVAYHRVNFLIYLYLN